MNEHLTYEQLTDYLHHGLAPEDDASAHVHLHECAQCRAAFQEEANIAEALRAYARETARDFPQGVRARILDAIAVVPKPSFAQRLQSWARPVIAVPIAAAIAIALLIVPHVVPTSQPPTIDAAYYLQDHADTNRTMPFADNTTAVPAALDSDAADTTASSVAVAPAVTTADVRY